MNSPRRIVTSTLISRAYGNPAAMHPTILGEDVDLTKMTLRHTSDGFNVRD
jgi:hypothetical protein